MTGDGASVTPQSLTGEERLIDNRRVDGEGHVEFGVARNIATALKVNGIDYCFLVTGGDQPLWIALNDAGIEMVLCRSEASAVYMADGYARACGKPGLVYGQWGPGAANVAAALAEAWWNRTPLMALTSSTVTDHHGKNDYQELDQLRMFAPVTKWNQAVVRPDRAGEMVRSALHSATNHVARPVHLDVPRDILEAPDVLRDQVTIRHGNLPSPHGGDVRRAVELLSVARAPIVIAGSGALLSGATEELEQVMSRLHIPVATSMGGKGAVREDAPLAVGVVGRYSRVVANALLREADCVLVIGSDLGGMVTNGYELPGKGARIIQVDVDPEVIGRNTVVDVAIHADARQTLQELLELLAPRVTPMTYEAWSGSVQRRLADWRQAFSDVADRGAVADVLQPASVFRALNDVMSPDDILVADTGYMAAWSGALFTIKQAGRRFMRAAGTLGWAYPAAMGAQLATPNARVVCVIGDGGFGYHIGDLETALRCDVPVITVVLNNSCLAFEYHMQKYYYDNRVIPAVNDLSNTDYSAVGRAFGMSGSRVHTYTELVDGLCQAYAAREPYLLDVIVDRESHAPVSTHDHINREL